MNKKLISLVLASMAVGALAGCNQSTPTPAPLPDEYNLMQYWQVNGEETYYDITTVGDNLVVSYENVTEYRFIGRSFAYDGTDLAKFAETYKKLTFTGALTATTGTNIVLLKFERTGWQFEKKFEFKSTTDSYDLSLANIPAEHWQSDLKVMLFVNMDTTVVGAGEMTFSKIALSKAEVNPAKDIMDGVLPQVYNEIGRAHV